MLTPHALAKVFAITTFAACVQGAVGFGVSLISAPLIVMIDPGFVPGPMIAAGTFLTILIAVRERNSIHKAGLAWALGGRVPGIGAALVLLSVVPKDKMGLLVGWAVLIAVVLSVAGWRVEVRPVNLFLAGSLSGLMGTSASIGGPPMALLYQRNPGPEFRGTMSAYFVVGGLSSLTALFFAGRFHAYEARLALYLLPGIITGFLLLLRFAIWLDRRRGLARACILGLCAVAGIVNVVRFAL